MILVTTSAALRLPPRLICSAPTESCTVEAEARSSSSCSILPALAIFSVSKADLVVSVLRAAGGCVERGWAALVPPEVPEFSPVPVPPTARRTRGAPPIPEPPTAGATERFGSSAAASGAELIGGGAFFGVSAGLGSSLGGVGSGGFSLGGSGSFGGSGFLGTSSAKTVWSFFPSMPSRAAKKKMVPMTAAWMTMETVALLPVEDLGALGSRTMERRRYLPWGSVARPTLVTLARERMSRMATTFWYWMPRSPRTTMVMLESAFRASTTAL